MPLFGNLDYLNIDVFWSMADFIFIVFGLAEDGDIYFWRTLGILFWPLFASFRQKNPK